MIKRIYALYEGETNICDGTLYEISRKTGLTMDYLLWMTRPSSIKRLMSRKKAPKCLVFVGEEAKMINSNRKGRDGEEELVRKIREQGFPRIRRSQQYCGGSDESADLVGLPNIHIECKRVEKLNIHRAIDQAIRDNGDRDDIPCVFHRKNRERWLVTMTIEDFFRLYSASDYGREKDEED